MLLLGPRQTGKSTLIASVRPHLTINLAHEPTYLDFARDPRELETRLAGMAQRRGRRTVFIDEVQRIPSLLNTLQSLLDARGRSLKFYLTGSSARKLRRGNANLLPGRIHTYSMGPVVSREANYQLPLAQALCTGTLPGILSEPDVAERQKTLRSYAATYVREEIQAESLTRSLEGFARFISASAEWSGQLLDAAKLAMAAQVARQSVARWLEVLEDTLLARRVESFAKSVTRRLVQHPKLYYFDVGVLNGLLGNFQPSRDRVGMLFEHLLCSQLFDSAAALDREIRVSHYRTEHGAEVDFIVEYQRELWAVEAKASHSVSPTDLRGFSRFADYYGKRFRSVVLFLGDQPRRIGSTDVLPWQQGLKAMGL